MILRLLIMLHILTFICLFEFCKSPKTHHEEVTCNRVSCYFPANLQPFLIKLRLSLPKILAVSMKRILFLLFISTFLFFVAWKWITYTAKHAKHFDIKTVGQKYWFFVEMLEIFKCSGLPWKWLLTKCDASRKRTYFVVVQWIPIRTPSSSIIFAFHYNIFVCVIFIWLARCRYVSKPFYRRWKIIIWCKLILWALEKDIIIVCWIRYA